MGRWMWEPRLIEVEREICLSRLHQDRGFLLSVHLNHPRFLFPDRPCLYTQRISMYAVRWLSWSQEYCTDLVKGTRSCMSRFHSWYLPFLTAQSYAFELCLCKPKFLNTSDMRTSLILFTFVVESQTMVAGGVNQKPTCRAAFLLLSGSVILMR